MGIGTPNSHKRMDRMVSPGWKISARPPVDPVFGADAAVAGSKRHAWLGGYRQDGEERGLRRPIQRAQLVHLKPVVPPLANGAGSPWITRAGEC